MLDVGAADELDDVDPVGGMTLPLSSRVYWCADKSAANFARSCGDDIGLFLGGCSPFLSHSNALLHVSQAGFGSHPASCHIFLTSDFFALFRTL